MKEIHFRTATFEDLPTLYDFEQGIIQAERPYDKTLKPGHINYYDLKAMLKSNETAIIVAVCKTEVVGSAYVTIKQAKPYLKHTSYAYLGFMFVKPEYRGMGINKGIIEETKNWARTKDINELCLDVYNDNLPAVRAYEKAGFKKHLLNMRMGI